MRTLELDEIIYSVGGPDSIGHERLAGGHLGGLGWAGLGWAGLGWQAAPWPSGRLACQAVSPASLLVARLVARGLLEPLHGVCPGTRCADERAPGAAREPAAGGARPRLRSASRQPTRAEVQTATGEIHYAHRNSGRNGPGLGPNIFRRF